MRTRDAVTATRRFGLGARPGELKQLAGDGRDYVRAQLGKEQGGVPAAGAWEGLGLSEIWLAQFSVVRARRRARRGAAGQESQDQAAGGGGMMKQGKVPGAKIYQEEAGARIRQSVGSDQPLLERLALFWSNHLCVSLRKNGFTRSLAGHYERSVIRPNILGNYREMLHAAYRHPAMLIYLDNHVSVDPDSRSGARRNKGINENLAREILELHTLGVEGGYSQADVIGLAHALAGWTIGRQKAPRPGAFVFRKNWHVDRSVQVLGKAYRRSGELQASEIIDDLVRHPATASFIARKLVRHFVGDSAPDALVSQVAAAFKRSDGDLRATTRALVEDDRAWSGPARKVLPPYDLMIATYRATASLPPPRFSYKTLRTFGQITWGVSAPAGWPDNDESWAAPDAMLERLDWATRVAKISRRQNRRGGRFADPRALADDILGDTLSDYTRKVLARAETPEQAMTLLIMSPEFQRR